MYSTGKEKSEGMNMIKRFFANKQEMIMSGVRLKSLVLYTAILAFTAVNPVFKSTALSAQVLPDLQSPVAVDLTDRINESAEVNRTFTAADMIPANTSPDDNNWDQLFQTPGTSGTVYAMQQAGNKIYITGDFAMAGGSDVNNVAYWDEQREVWLPLGKGIPDFKGYTIAYRSENEIWVGGEPGSGQGARIYLWNGNDWIPQKMESGVIHALYFWQNDLYAGGEFDFIADGIRFKSIARLENGSWSPLGEGIRRETDIAGIVYTMSMDLDGDLLIGGSFSYANERRMVNLTRWDGQEFYDYNGGVHLAGGGEAAVHTIEPSKDGKAHLYIGGLFNIVGYPEVSVSNIAMWDGKDWLDLNGGVDNTVRVIRSNDEAMYAGGDFDQVSGFGGARRLAVWSGTNWNWLGGISDLVNDTVYDLVVGTGKEPRFYVAGKFERIGVVTHISHRRVDNIARYDGGWHALGKGFRSDELIRSSDMDQWGRVYVGGEFEYAGGIPSRNVAMWDGTGWQNLGMGVNNVVYAVRVDGNQVYIGGGFLRAIDQNGLEITASRIARWSNNGWEQLESSDILVFACEGVNDGEVRTIDIDQATGTILVGGSFLEAGCKPASRVATWNGVWNQLGDGLPGLVNVILRASDVIYAGGMFSGTDKQKFNNVAWITNPNSSWRPVGGFEIGETTPGVSDGEYMTFVSALSIDCRGDLWIGGNFRKAGDIFGYGNIAKFSREHGWSKPGMFNSIVFTLKSQECSMYAGGNFFSETMNRTLHYQIARWNLAKWQSLGHGLLGGPTRTVTTIAVNESRLFAGGTFEKGGEIRSFKFAGWDMKGMPADKHITFIGAIDTTSSFEYGQFIDIQWSSAINDLTVKLDYSLNNGHTWVNLAEGLPSSGSYIWFVPDVEIRTAAFRVSDMSAPEYIHDTRTDYRIAGTASREIYVLKRPVEGSSEKEPFRVDRHGWNFGNFSNNIWPEEYWSIFDYPKLASSTAARNLSSSQKLYLLFDTPKGEWVDMWAWCDPKQTCLANGAFGNPKYIKPSAFDIWIGQALLNDGFGGSCYGFSLSTLLFFDRFYDMGNHFPGITNLQDAALSNKSRRFINTHQIAQFRKHAFILNAYRLAADNPSDTIERLKESLQRDRDHEVITMMLTVTRGHSVVPYRMVKAPDSNIWTIYVYDPNLPGDFNTYIEVNTDTEEWVFSGTLNKNKLKKDQSPEDVPFEPWSGKRWGLITTSPIRDLQVAGRIGSHAHFNFKREGSADEIEDAAEQMIAHSSEMQMTEMPLTGQEPDPDDFIELHVAPVFDIIVQNQGGVLGFSNDELAAAGGIGYPVQSIAPDTYNERPFAYALLSGASEYTIEMTNNNAGIKSLVWMDGGVSYIYNREGVDSEDMDVIRISDTVDFSNPGMSAKIFNFDIEYEGSNDTLKYIGLSRLRLDGNTNMNFDFKNRRDLFIINRSGDQVAGVEIIGVNPGHEYSDFFSDVPLRGYATHWIEPRWDIPGSPIKLHTDTNNDGIWNETILVNPALPEGSSSMMIVPGDDVAAAGYPLTLQVQAGNFDHPVEDLFGAGFRMSFDPDLVEFSEIRPGSFLPVDDTTLLTFSEVSDGEIAFSITRTEGTGISGTGQLAEIDFKVRAGTGGQTALFFLSDILANDSNGLVVSLVQSGTSVKIVDTIIWPGDTNNDGIVTAADALAIAYYYDLEGPVRTDAFVPVWEAQPAEPWFPIMGTFADANGDGSINSGDLDVVSINFGKSIDQLTGDAVSDESVYGWDITGSSAKITTENPLAPGGSVIKFTLDPGSAGTPYRIRMDIGSDTDPVTAFRGLAAHLHYPKELVMVSEIIPGNLLDADDLILFEITLEDPEMTAFALGRTSASETQPGNGTVVELVMSLRQTTTEAVTVTLSDLWTISDSRFDTADLSVVSVTSTSAAEVPGESLPVSYSLDQNYPNPFNPVTNMRYNLPVDSPVRLEVFDLLGRRVALLYDGLQKAGRHSALFDATRLSSGMYIYRIQTPEFTQTRKMMLVK